jgi:hypothetical protein
MKLKYRNIDRRYRYWYILFDENKWWLLTVLSFVIILLICQN